MKNFKVIDFRFADVNDNYDEKYAIDGVWSRLYEYHYVLNTIKMNMLKNMSKPKIHNSSWGFAGIHVPFRDELDGIGECIHSDIQNSDVRDTYYYDITMEEPEFENYYDFVLNISTIEHLDGKEKRFQAIENLWKQVKVGGYLILTFDYPRVNLSKIEVLIDFKCKQPINVLNGENSINPNKNYKDLNIIYLVLKKLL